MCSTPHITVHNNALIHGQWICMHKGRIKCSRYQETLMTIRGFVPGKTGWVEVVTGCMFSGKTEEVIRRAKRALIARQQVIAFKHANDSGRYDLVQLASHCGERLMATPVDSVAQMDARVTQDVVVIVIDEAQFFCMELIEFLNQHRRAGRRIIISGLNKDFAGNPFPGPMPAVLAIADDISVQTAICTECGEPAGYSQRLTSSQATIEVGKSDRYAARCLIHWSPNVVPMVVTT